MYKIDGLLPKELNYIKTLVTRNLKEDADSLTRWSYKDGYNANNILLSISKNKELINFINTKTKFSFEEVTSLHYIEYKVGTSLAKHKDEVMLNIKNHQGSVSVVFLLAMCEEGGQFLLEDKNVVFNRPGQYISFDGEQTYHEVTEVKKGTREVLVLWYKPQCNNVKSAL